MSSESQRITIIGGGITGIAAALRLSEIAPDKDLLLLEAADRLGGVLDTDYRDGYLVERAADMFTMKLPWARELSEAVGYSDLMQPNVDNRRAYLIRRGKLTPVPEGFSLLKPVKLSKMMVSPLLSVRGKLRLLYERFVPMRKEATDESLASFAQRRLGREVYERIVQPLIGGIYTADPHKLSMQATLPQFPAMEREHGSLIRAALRDSDTSEQLASGARYDQFVTPRKGFRHWIDHLVEHLPEHCVRTGAKVASIEPAVDSETSRWTIHLASGESIPSDSVLMASPAHVSAGLVASFDSQLSEDLKSITYAGASVVLVACRRDQIEHPLDGFGLVAPLIENRKVLAVSFSSVKFAGRAPADRVLLRVFVGGAVQPELLALNDDDLRELVKEELQDLLGLRGDPEWTEVVRWDGAMPQYHVGHLELVDRIEQRCRQHPGLDIAGAAYRGVGIPFCIRSGRAAADRLV